MAVWILWLARRSHVMLTPWRSVTVAILRLLLMTVLLLALAGTQWRLPRDGLNIFYVLDRSQSIPAYQQDAIQDYVSASALLKRPDDGAGVVVFGSQAGVESSINHTFDFQQIHAVVDVERTDLASAIRLASAAFPETGQKRLVLISDGNENMGNAREAALAARSLDISIDVLPVGIVRAGDVAVQRLTLPSKVKKGQAFEVRIHVESDQSQPATVRLFRNQQLLGDQRVMLSAGKNLFSFPQTLEDPKFYQYEVHIDAGVDALPQNNRAIHYTNVKGDPRLLFVASNLEEDSEIIAALQGSRLAVHPIAVNAFPQDLAAITSHDAIVLSNVAAGELSRSMMRLIMAAVRDFGVGLVCIGGDQAYAAGGYRGTPLEDCLPVDMELSSKKILPHGALALIMHGMEFNNGNQVARQVALGVLDALSPRDELGVVLWDGTERWLFPIQPVSEKRKLGKLITGMSQGDLPSFQNVMAMAYEGLKKSTAHLKHIIVFSDGDPGAPSQELMDDIVQSRITVSTVLISGHAGPQTMIWIASEGNGRFYNVVSPQQLPQIFIKEAAVVLKSAISEEPFKPEIAVRTEPIAGIPPEAYPTLFGHVTTTAKPRAEIPLLTSSGDPLLAHWQFGLGRAVAFTSDAKARWAREWLNWDQFRRFWSQVVSWSLRRVEDSDLAAEIIVEKGEGIISVEAVDPEGNFRNFLNLDAQIVGPAGDSRAVTLHQSGPGTYEARFPTRETGGYMVNLTEKQDGAPPRSQQLGASVNYSPEFQSPRPNIQLLQRLAEIGKGKVLSLDDGPNPFQHDRIKTIHPVDLWPYLLMAMVCLFPLDVALRRIQIDREEWLKATATLTRWISFWKRRPQPAKTEESLVTLLRKRDEVRTRQGTRTATLEHSGPQRSSRSASLTPDAPPAEAAPSSLPKKPGKDEPEAPTITTSRLLEAKRRAKKRR